MNFFYYPFPPFSNPKIPLFTNSQISYSYIFFIFIQYTPILYLLVITNVEFKAYEQSTETIIQSSEEVNSMFLAYRYE
jgi:hypothetical protein